MGDGVFLAVADLSCVWMWGWLVSCPCLYRGCWRLEQTWQEIKPSPLFHSTIATTGN